jgi:hypothetical protein
MMMNLDAMMMMALLVFAGLFVLMLAVFVKIMGFSLKTVWYAAATSFALVLALTVLSVVGTTIGAG